MPTNLSHFENFLPTQLLGPTHLLDFKFFSHLHCYLDSTVIQHLRVYLLNYSMLSSYLLPKLSAQHCIVKHDTFTNLGGGGIGPPRPPVPPALDWLTGTTATVWCQCGFIRSSLLSFDIRADTSSANVCVLDIDPIQLLKINGIIGSHFFLFILM